jgi:hypothetical protein
MICRPPVEFTIESVGGALLRAGLVRGDTLPLGCRLILPVRDRRRTPPRFISIPRERGGGKCHRLKSISPLRAAAAVRNC